ncbi:hypothetical protein DRO53_01405 [Candidatus Bathyarchaeota archaeon]|nr:MAG: hypothetical protein DRO53_01405 [Candidatus Bathyarchaeota archaeon]
MKPSSGGWLKLIVKRLRLENIRSHRKTEITFTEGFNCVVGGVGAGKTSILLAIHFALFGEPLYRSYDYLLREDQNRGIVDLEFEQAGKTYRIVRGLQRDWKGKINQKPDDIVLTENGKMLASTTVTAVQNKLKEILGMTKSLFEGFVWIQQEKLKDILDRPPSERQRLLDELFGLSTFEEAWEKLREYSREHRTIRDTLERDSLVRNLPNLTKEYDQTLSDKIKLEVELETIKVDLSEAETELKKAEEEFKRLKSLDREVSKLKEEKARLSAELEEASKNAKKAKASFENAERTIKELELKIGALKAEEKEVLWRIKVEHGLEISEVEEISKLIGDLEVECEWLNTRLSEAKSSLSKVKENLEEVKGERCPTCRRPITPEYRETLLSQLKAEAEERLGEIEKLNGSYMRKKGLLDSLRKAWDKLSKIHSDLENLSERLAESRKQAEQWKEELSNILSRIPILEERIKEIDAKISAFKIEVLEEAENRKSELERKIEKFKEALRIQEQRLKEKEQHLTRLESQIEEAKRKREEIAFHEAVLAFIEELREAYRAVVPFLREAYIEALKAAVQSVMDNLTQSSGRSFEVEIDRDYTPILIEDSRFKRSSMLISGGERTWLSLAYKIGLSQLVFESRTGQPLELLILDEPTEALGSEDRSIEDLSNALQNLKAIRQIIVVTHSEDLAKAAAHRILVEKVGGESQVKSF